MAIEIVSFPMKNGGSFHSYVTVYQRVSGFSVDVFDDRPIFCPWSSAKKVWKKVTWNRTQVDASQLGSFMGEASRYKKTLHYNQWKFQDPKLEVLYHIRPHFLGIFPYIGLIYGRYLQFRILKFPLIQLKGFINQLIIGETQGIDDAASQVPVDIPRFCSEVHKHILLIFTSTSFLRRIRFI